jgi:hypothetical protein
LLETRALAGFTRVFADTDRDLASQRRKGDGGLFGDWRTWYVLSFRSES